MKRILIAYYSLGGHTARVARDLAVRLDADVLELREVANRHGFLGHVRAALDAFFARHAILEAGPWPAGPYELTLVGTPVWAGRITPAARTFLELVRDQPGEIAFFTTSGGTDAAQLVPAVEKIIDRRAAAFGGMTHRDLRDAAIYQHHLDALVTAVKLRPLHRGDEPGVKHAHA